jgi:retron-type reverse transcriptase
MESELGAIRHELETGTFRFGSYRRFTILDPKKRIICAAPFRERVVHHAMVRVMGPELERFQIHHSYACRVGKGTERAVLQAFSWARSSPWFVKLDVRKYYDSIDHILLFQLLQKRFKDPRLLDQGLAHRQPDQPILRQLDKVSWLKSGILATTVFFAAALVFPDWHVKADPAVLGKTENEVS